MEKRSMIATLAAAVGSFSALAAAAGPIAAQLELLPPFAAFRLFGLGVVPGAALALLLGIVGLLVTRASSGLAGRGLAWTGAGLGVLLLGVLFTAASGGSGAPAIHDISTDMEDPPTFGPMLGKAEGRVNGIIYPDGGPDVPAQQRIAYPDLKPIEVPWEGIIAYEHVKSVVEELGWDIALARKSGGRIEASDVSKIFKFVDDVSIRITNVDYDTSVVDIRSNSRVGLSDLGANAARIRKFRDLLLARASQEQPS